MDRVQDARQVADVDEPAADGGGGLANEVPGGVLPPQLAGVEVDGEKVAVSGAGVDDAVRYRGGRLEALTPFIGPFQRERRGELRGDARQAGVPSELGPARKIALTRRRLNHKG